MAEMSWKDAAKRVLEAAGKPLHYVEITDRILDQGLKTKSGATPSTTLNSTINWVIQTDGDGALFERTAPGTYALRVGGKRVGEPPDDDVESGSLEAFAMYWRRDLVHWSSNPRLYGRQHPKADRVNLAGQHGVYLLHDGHGVVYVGQVAKQSLGQRLAQHTTDRLAGRWQSFSWFGIRPVGADGKLGDTVAGTITPARLISTLEALLIEALEPRQNRAGSSYSGIEYLQVTDPKL